MMSRAFALTIVLACGCGSSEPSEPDPDPGDGPDVGDDVGWPDDGDDDGGDDQPSWPFDLPEGFPQPRLPDGERLTRELAELGRYLFYDIRLSANQTQACGSCHRQELAFSDGRTVPVGSTGDELRRNAMSLTNIAFNPTHTWANPQADTLEAQALVPIFGEVPIELGATGHEDEILQRLREDPLYQEMFAAAFPDQDDAFSFPNIVRALSAFERRLVSGDSRVDRYRNGDTSALDESEARGYDLFFTEELECHHCHGGFNFSIAVDYAELPGARVHFFNNGLYNVGGNGDYPEVDQGLWEFTFEDTDRGRYRPPTLRNVGVTAPYMHDGSVATLEEVIAIYERGGRVIEDGPLAGDGREHPNKSPFVGGFILTDQERADLLAFLRALTDESFLTDESLSDPFAER
jgi:cytochrome c peroxidase